MAKAKATPEPDGRLFRFELTVEHDLITGHWEKGADGRSKYVRDGVKRTTVVMRNGKGGSATAVYDNVRQFKSNVTRLKNNYGDSVNPVFTLKVFYVDPEQWIERPDLGHEDVSRALQISERADVEEVLGLDHATSTST